MPLPHVFEQSEYSDQDVRPPLTDEIKNMFIMYVHSRIINIYLFVENTNTTKLCKNKWKNDKFIGKLSSLSYVYRY